MSAAACTVAGEPGSVAQARHWVGDVLRTAGCDNWLVEDAVAVTSELVTNAVRHTASGQPEGTVRIEVLTGACRVRVSVIDGGTEFSEPTVPRCCPDPDLPEAPRGLYLVDRWAERFAFCGDGRGRTVFADLTGTDEPADAMSAALPQRRPHAARSGDNGGGRSP